MGQSVHRILHFEHIFCVTLQYLARIDAQIAEIIAVFARLA
jgi:hypothetical protein